jgi:hypothetical protein
MIEDTDDDLEFGSYQAICKGCDAYALVDDIGLCEDCAAKMDRDLIRKRDWDYSATAFGCPVDRREELRDHIIAEYGEALEILVPEPPGEGRSTRRKRRRRSRR